MHLGQDEDFDEDVTPETPEEAEEADRAEIGEVCSNCGTEFEEAHGHPVLCHDCWEAADDEDKIGLKEATHDEVQP